ncbi:MAG TPA: histidine phosphatase family protein [Streptosporangiaceae bacterium]|nr:histidine phosphatase family protein [Streptosporangiaceae bacterium]
MSIWSGGEGPEIIKLVLWRHGQTTFNVERRFQGQTDVPLNDVGLAQASQAAPYLAALSPDAIFSSDLSRAAATAAALADLTGLQVQLDKDLRERGGGSWEGMTAAEIQQRFPEAYAAWEPPDGESAAAVADRAEAAMHRIADSMPGGGIAVVVGHGGTLGFGAARLLGIPDGLRALGPFGNCRWSVLSRRYGKWRLLEHNAGVLPEPVLATEAVPDAEPDGEAGREA